MEQAEQKKVLFINNNSDVQERVKTILDDQADYELFIADTAGKAFEIIENNRINFVLFDVDVALEEGVNKLLEMKEKYPDIPIVATTPVKKGDIRDSVPPLKK
ncbi:MAG: response regulator [Firmicutes bacterium]|nr:response regulator [Bacillota bacterium]